MNDVLLLSRSADADKGIKQLLCTHAGVIFIRVKIHHYGIEKLEKRSFRHMSDAQYSPYRKFI